MGLVQMSFLLGPGGFFRVLLLLVSGSVLGKSTLNPMDLVIRLFFFPLIRFFSGTIP